jgi:hypothetical protein
MRDACELYRSDFAKITSCKTNRETKKNNNVSEGIDANYQDMINYSIFALILMGFGK